ncbi:MAG TPA: hypothetical protein VER11_19290 [Polyangiaceae bacterium]|nr:hypothetical protein [Polyangiaceae bacterium]
MRIRYAFLGAPLLMLSFVALAQPKRAAKEPEDKAAPAKSEKADKSEKAEPKSDSAASGGDDLGGPPPPKAAGASDSNKPSPLNPEANEFADGGSQPAPAEYDKLLGDIATLRSRVSALTTTLFASKVRVVVETRGAEARVSNFTVTLDDGVVFSAPERFSAEDERIVYEHSVAPGHHVLGVDVERFDTRNKEYRTWQSSRFSVVIPESKLVDAHLVIQDASDMGKDFPDDQDGEYDLRVRLRARVVK